MAEVIVDRKLPLQASEEHNEYLHHDAFRPVDKEITATDLSSIGDIPKDIDGVYIRNGHNPVYQPKSGRYHWFDGDGMVHATTFADGKATFRNRMVMTTGLAAEMEAGRGLYPGLRDGFEAEEGLKNSSGTDVVLHNGEFKTLFSRCGQPYRLAADDFRTLGPDDFKGSWERGISAHSKVDERTGELIFFNYSFNSEPFMEYGVIDKDNRVSSVTAIDLPGPRLPHDSWVTENYTVLHDLPLYWDSALLALGKKKLKFDRDLASRFGVIPRHGSGGDIRWFECEPTYMLHTVNAWEDGDEIVAFGFKQLTPIPKIPRETPSARVQNYFLSFQFNQPRLTEYRFNLRTGKASERIVDEQCLEMPNINARYLGIRNRYAYNTMAAEIPYFLMSGIQKFDLQNRREVDRYELPKGKYMGQPVFSPRVGAKDEDDGYLISYVSEANHAEIYIWQAQTLGDGPIARIPLPQRIPGGSHAYWGNGSDIREAQMRQTANSH